MKPDSRILILLLSLIVCTTAGMALADDPLLAVDFNDGTSGAFLPRDDCWSVIGGEYVCDAAGYQYYSQSIVRSRHWQDYVFECDLRVEGSLNQMVFMRYQNPNRFYEINVRGTPYNDVLIFKWAGRSQKFLAQAPCANTAGETHHYEIRLVGDLIEVSFDGLRVLEHRDLQNPYLWGGVALVGYTGGAIQWQTAYYDNVTVQTEQKSSVLAVDQCSWDELKALYR